MLYYYNNYKLRDLNLIRKNYIILKIYIILKLYFYLEHSIYLIKNKRFKHKYLSILIKNKYL